MPIRQLPPGASLEHLKKQAKSLVKAIRQQDRASIARVKFYFSEPDAIGLQDAQLVIAREYGFSSWRKLRRHFDSLSPPDQLADDQLANDFLRLVVLTYSETETADPERFEQALALLQKHPQIRNENIYTAVACGDVERVESWLQESPSLLDQKGGYHHWEPLMYAAYARLPGVSTLAVGRLLLERGANPDAHYLWGGQYRFTALTGVFGHGEAGPERLPEHPEWEAFARLLLDAGALPNDSQALYNRMLSGDNRCLQMLLEYGLTRDDMNNWYLREGDQLVPHPDGTLHYQLCHAVQTGNFEKLELLCAHGVDLNQAQDGRFPYQMALLAGDDRIARYLLEHGAERRELDPVDRLRLACLKPDRTLARQLLETDPDLVDKMLQATPDILEHALGKPTTSALEFMLELGVDANHFTYRGALHQAAWMGRIDMMRCLIDAGADPGLRDHHYFGPPLAWAIHNNQAEAIEFLEGCEMDIFTAAAREILPRLQSLLAADPDLLEIRFGDIRPNPDQACDRDWMTPLVVAIGNRRYKAVEYLLSRGADARVNDGRGRNALSVARETGDAQLLALVESPTAASIE